MSTLKEMVKLLCDRPRMADRRIAAAVRVSHDTVRRHRRALHEQGCDWCELEGLSDEELRVRFHRPKYRPPRKTRPDVERLHQILSRRKATMEDAWMDYRQTQPVPHMGLSAFRKFAREHYEHGGYQRRCAPMPAPVPKTQEVQS